MAEDKSTPVMVRLPRDLLEALDAYRRRQDDLPTRPEAVRRILTEQLKA